MCRYEAKEGVSIIRLFMSNKSTVGCMTRSGDWVVVVNAPKVAFPSCFFMPDRAERLDPTSEWMHSVPIDTQAEEG